MKEIKPETGGVLNVFEKGESGNPKGRPPGRKSFKRILKEILAQPMDVEFEGRMITLSRKEVAMLLLVRNATDEDQDPNIQMKAAAMIMEKLEPKHLEQKPENNNPGQVVIIRIPDNGRDEMEQRPGAIQYAEDAELSDDAALPEGQR